MFNILDEIFGNLNDNSYVKLQKEGDINFEVDTQTKKIETDGHRILSTISRDSEIIIIYRMLIDLEEKDEPSIHIRACIINEKGILVPDLRLDAVYFKEASNIDLCDIRIFGTNQNKGYGTLMLKELFEIARRQKVKDITGWISPVDYDHVDRIKHFYEKNGFIVNLDKQRKGKIYWKNNQISV